MTENILNERFIDIGLTKNEADVYLSCLKSGLSPVSCIAKNASMNRVTAYGVLEKLVKKGYVQPIKKSGVQKYLALHPDILVQNTKQKAQALEGALPDLKQLMTPHEFRPNVRFYERIKGIKEAYAETLCAKTKICNYANSQNIREHWPNYDKEYVEKRKKRKIFLCGLAPDDAIGRQVQSEDKKFFRETRLMKQSQFWVENEIKIFNDSMLIASFDPYPFAALIESKAVAYTQRQIFENMWNYAN